MPHGFPRSRRIEDLLRKEVADILLSEIKDPRVHGLVTIMQVKVSEDLCYARFFVSVLGSESERESVLEGLNKAKGFIRQILGHRLDLRRIPEIRFQLDRSLDYQEKIERLLASVRTGQQVEN
ncbi:MAG: 30S ribosome-binding factor RbfA [Deltaproteobacteria bacterium]|nr:30S ribosome-binding factor RbfA [Deltaproteobacteria bacterium]MCW7073238.1 30S ribosome-binding factor RbfA [Methanophagales archaeon]RKX60087.1 MAG: 30S ribosome-binding factor RbfA [Thermodesulfobacteriota bacterium]MBW1946912.1 30S ribosome-binding factor RbfA [Deltaproteobacteria bacterium]MBW1967031.1 30S ribosome-binding factor RbfA [Deltaproteobacteria bacterium]